MRPHLLYQAKKKFPQNIGIIAHGEKIHYQDYFSISHGIKQYLKKYYKVSKGTKVVLQLENSIYYAFFVMALQMLKALTIHLNNQFPIELKKQLLNNIYDITTKQNILIITNKGNQTIKNLNNSQILEAEKIVNASKIITQINEDDDPYGSIENQQWVDITFTSASTGKPQAVLHTYGNHYYSALGSNINLSLKYKDLWLISLPLFHVGGQAILYRAALAGASIIFTKLNDFEKILSLHHVTHLSLVPTQLYRLLENEKICTQLSKLKVILVGGAYLPKTLLELSIKKRINLYLSYGSSEMSSQISTTSRIITNKLKANVGTPLTFRKLILNSQKEILVKGPCLFPGYYTQKGVRLPLNQNGYFHTGDLGKITEDGFLKILARKDNMFISGGENIYPEEIEKALDQTGYIKAALVVGVHNLEFGKRPIAFIDLKSTWSWKDQIPININKQLQHILPHFKIPIRYFQLPKQKNLKYSRRELEDYANKLIISLLNKE